jgi:cob(I)alamin adenosyltransferase
LVRTFVQRADAKKDVTDQLEMMLEHIQNDLFNLGADLATVPSDRWEGMRLINAGDIDRLEQWIDTLNVSLPPLKDFILPGGGPVGAFLHQARTVCRRAERTLVRLGELEPESLTTTLPYLNRLSDFLYVLGRWAAAELGEPEFLWSRERV